MHIGVEKLDWSLDNSEFIKNYLSDTDLVIAADIIYDNTLFHWLLSTLKNLLEHCKNISRFLLVNAVRNPDTEQEFLNSLRKFYCNTKIDINFNIKMLKLLLQRILG